MVLVKTPRLQSRNQSLATHSWKETLSINSLSPDWEHSWKNTRYVSYQDNWVWCMRVLCSSALQHLHECLGCRTERILSKSTDDTKLGKLLTPSRAGRPCRETKVLYPWIRKNRYKPSLFVFTSLLTALKAGWEKNYWGICLWGRSLGWPSWPYSKAWLSVPELSQGEMLMATVRKQQGNMVWRVIPRLESLRSNLICRACVARSTISTSLDLLTQHKLLQVQDIKD